MHEFSTMAEVVRVVEDEARRRNARVKEVRLEVGELSFLCEEQLRFAFEVLTEQSDVLRGSKLVIEGVKAEIKCEHCGYEGGVRYADDFAYHFSPPILQCPRCNSFDVRIVKGRGCVVKEIVVTLD